MKKINIMGLISPLLITTCSLAMESMDVCQKEKHAETSAVDQEDFESISEEPIVKDYKFEDCNEEKYWDNLPDELKIYTLLNVLTAKDMLHAIDTKQDKVIARLFKQWALLSLVSKDMSRIISDKAIFNLDEIIKHLIEKYKPYAFTILKQAAKMGCISALKLLSKNGFLASDLQREIMIIASQNKQHDFCKELISNGILTEDITNLPLINAIFLHDYNKIEDLIESELGEASLDDGTNQLMLAAAIGDINIVQMFLKANQDINQQNKLGFTALMNAAFFGYEMIVKLLVNKGAHINLKANDGQAALIYAAKSGHQKIVEFLVNKDADIDLKDNQGKTALIWTAVKGYQEIADFLVNKGACLDLQDSTGAIALMAASRYGYLEMVKYLVSKGAFVNHQSDHGVTALICAAFYGCKEIVEFLVNNGALVNHQRIKGVTALMAAVVRGHLEIVEVLVDNGVDINLQDRQGNTALMKAVQERHEEIVAFLSKIGN